MARAANTAARRRNPQLANAATAEIKAATKETTTTASFPPKLVMNSQKPSIGPS